MTTETVESVKHSASLEISDEEFMKQPSEVFLEDPKGSEENTSDKQQINPADQTAEEIAAAKTAANSEAQEQTDATANKEEVGQSDGDTQTKLEPSRDSDAEESLDTSNLNKSDTKGDTPDTKQFDYESAYKKVSEPFKANGVEMRVDNPEDMIKLMQKGAGYQKKMADLQPHLKVIKMLQNNNLLDEGKLHNLIDLANKDPKAIAKLIKESGLDPLDIDTEGAKDYQPKNHSVGDKEFALDSVLEDLKDSPTFTKTIDVLTKEWDPKSKTAVADTPEIITIIDSHMSNGVYDKVNTVMQQEKALGKLTGVSDLDAYMQITEHLERTGILKMAGSQGVNPSTVSSELEAKKLAEEAQRNKEREAAAPVNLAATKEKAKTAFLNLSDADFLKQGPPG